MKGNPKPKIGAEHASAALRQGFNELGNALITDSNIAQPYREYGLFGTMTPGEVADARRNSEHTLGQESPKGESILESRMRQSEQRTPAGESREPVMDR